MFVSKPESLPDISMSSNHMHLLMLPTSSTNPAQSRGRLDVVIDDLYASEAAPFSDIRLGSATI